ncbi:Estradiol 17-beta-dehydrogenase 2 [Araneus ventricosus]|uniref:Estradiol 17-beta-dehydrogenase 2 n=1 Tax=Araneus ventricosus TaxID=182803 RepID=A0A4Y2FCJ4_ARAVE|nr:Estradiol 17-beta-dehydrogenase 2 [Araneus ventricosus]
MTNSGCDSRFGYLLAQRLDRKGFKVFASCLFPHGPGANELQTILSEHSKVFRLDVTKQGSIRQALRFVEDNLGSYELRAVVNNAGIRKGFSMELSSMQDFEDCMDVNALGHVRITKAFLNLLKTFKGRIINVNSIFSRIPIAGIIPYCMSKYAAVGFNDCLRAELASTGIKVISVESTAFLSPITEMDVIKKSLEEKIAENEDEIMKYYGKSYIQNYRKLCTFFMRNTSKEIHLAVNDLEYAVCCQYPDRIYNTCPKVVSRSRSTRSRQFTSLSEVLTTAPQGSPTQSVRRLNGEAHSKRLDLCKLKCRFQSDDANRLLMRFHLNGKMLRSSRNNKMRSTIGRNQRLSKPILSKKNTRTVIKFLMHKNFPSVADIGIGL